MRIKDYKCKCGHNDFFFADKGNQTGIYCSYCGKWLKWADKDEQNLTLKQEPKTGRWIAHREHCEMNNLRPSGLGSYFWCSECDCGIDVKEWRRNNYNYCPNCGAKMEGET